MILWQCGIPHIVYLLIYFIVKFNMALLFYRELVLQILDNNSICLVNRAVTALLANILFYEFHLLISPFIVSYINQCMILLYDVDVIVISPF